MHVPVLVVTIEMIMYDNKDIIRTTHTSIHHLFIYPKKVHYLQYPLKLSSVY